MPARQEPTDAELRAQLERRREQTRLRMRRSRARHLCASPEAVRVTDPTRDGLGDAHPPTPPVPSPSSLEEGEGDGAKIARILAPFAGRGYVHSAEFWADVAANYPDVRLVMEARKVASWLTKPLKKNREADCSEGFLINWLRKAQREATAPPPNGQGPLAALPDVPPGGVRNPGPAPVLPAGTELQMIDPAQAQRALLQAKRLTLPEKLALAKNGRHP